ncbi:ArsR/SmtB family transcription factor [Ralstonia wenshanensis]|uniref:ArsR/SmtB family transcription factor n=1 Tax=Ralstonia wenshanensis TaxID=2842456 RepID=UPI0039C71CE7
MSHPNSFSGTAFLIADPARAAMLTALLDGRALPAGELAHAAGVTAQTASTHLAKLLDGGLVVLETEGRHKYFRLAGAHVAQALEHLAAITPAAAVRRATPSPKARELGFCRCCYDHLAGQVGVAVTQALQSRGYLLPMPDKQYEITPAGITWFGDVGLDVRAIRSTRRGLARQCLDWTERTHHLAGPLGVQFLRRLCDAGWMLRARDSRAVLVTPKGWQELHQRLGVDETTVRSEAAHRHA